MTDVRQTLRVIDTPIDVIDWDAAVARILRWAEARESRYVCICNVHSVVTATTHPALARALLQADMATPDGAPIAWMLRRLGAVGQKRINGPDLMLKLAESASRAGVSVFLFGSTETTLERLRACLRTSFPGLKIAGAIAPPFRVSTPDEQRAHCRAIADSGAGIVFVSLGCPKQETWMANQRARVPAVMIGVGAAFDFHAGVLRRAPSWMRQAGLEWVHRLASEPRRLWKRYLITNTLFLVRASAQLIRHQR